MNRISLYDKKILIGIALALMVVMDGYARRINSDIFLFEDYYSGVRITGLKEELPEKAELAIPSELFIPESIGYYKEVLAIAEGAFHGNLQLMSIILPHTLTEIEASAFEGCANLRAVIFPFFHTFHNEKSEMIIGNNAFRACSRLERITLPTWVTVKTNAFFGAGLKDIYCIHPTQPPTIEEYAFGNDLSAVTLHVLTNCRDVYEQDENWKKILFLGDSQILKIKAIEDNAEDVKYELYQLSVDENTPAMNYDDSVRLWNNGAESLKAEEIASAKGVGYEIGKNYGNIRTLIDVYEMGFANGRDYFNEIAIGQGTNVGYDETLENARYQGWKDGWIVFCKPQYEKGWDSGFEWGRISKNNDVPATGVLLDVLKKRKSCIYNTDGLIATGFSGFQLCIVQIDGIVLSKHAVNDNVWFKTPQELNLFLGNTYTFRFVRNNQSAVSFRLTVQ